MDKKVPSLLKALDVGFVWTRSVEGYRYWQDISDIIEAQSEETKTIVEKQDSPEYINRLRDEFAMAVMQGSLASGEKRLTSWYYEKANAMLTERERHLYK